MEPTRTLWPEDKVAAVSLAYDGSSDAHLDQVLPALSTRDLTATFYCYPPQLLNRGESWREAAKHGHELGNHTFFGAADDQGLLPQIPPAGVSEEVEDGCALLQSFASGEHSFAYPLLQTSIGQNGLPALDAVVRNSVERLNREMLQSAVSRFYRVARGPLDGFNFADSLEALYLRTYRADGLDGDSLCMMTHLGISQGAWVILSFGSAIDAHAHERLCKCLAERHEQVWIAPVAQVGNHLARRPEVPR